MKEEALEVVRQMIADGQIAQDVAERYFPELKESEESRDEKIRKALIETFKFWGAVKDCPYMLGISKEDALTWLEKQGEHKKFRDNIQIGDEVTRNKDGVLVNISQLKRKAKKNNRTPKPSFDEAQGTPVVDKISNGWSEEDEKKLNIISRILTTDSNEKMLNIDGYTAVDIAAWLVSLRGRIGCEANCTTTWKPSNEQIAALDGICSYIRNKADWEISLGTISDLYKLSEQLKKLRDE